MGRFVKGDVVVVPFPFSDLSASKRRPALIRPNRIFTADANIVHYRAGAIRSDKLHEVIDKIVQIITG